MKNGYAKGGGMKGGKGGSKGFCATPAITPKKGFKR